MPAPESIPLWMVSLKVLVVVELRKVLFMVACALLLGRFVEALVSLSLYELAVLPFFWGPPFLSAPGLRATLEKSVVLPNKES